MKRVQERLNLAGIEDLNPRGTHILLSLTEDNRLVLDKDGHLDYHICSFDMLEGLDFTELPSCHDDATPAKA
ncbi:MAG: hypothetical protein JXR97_07655 [Planctomycetes bacterium]|nr:hypothetical protein [Planctomycetota bacterium]